MRTTRTSPRTRLASLAVVALLGGLTACGGDEPAPTDDAASNAAPEPESSEAPAEPESPEEEAESESAAPTSASMMIEDFEFSDPGTVAPGAKITVENVDAVTHTVTADDGDFDVPVGPGETVTFTAPSGPGDYGFTCTPHPAMTGTLVVGGG